MSWTADGKWLAFNWVSYSTTSTAPDGTWLLDTTLSGTHLLADSRYVESPASVLPPASASTPVPVGTGVPIPLSLPACWGDLIVTPDGSAVVCGATATISPYGIAPDTLTEFYEFSTATGRIARVLGNWRIKNVGIAPAGVLWSSPSGSVLIGVIPSVKRSGQIGIIAGNEFTPLNVPQAGSPGVGPVW